MGLTLAHAAFAARQVTISNMIRAIRAVSSERGRDPATTPYLRSAVTVPICGGNGARTEYETHYRATGGGSVFSLWVTVRRSRTSLLVEP